MQCLSEEETRERAATYVQDCLTRMRRLLRMRKGMAGKPIRDHEAHVGRHENGSGPEKIVLIDDENRVYRTRLGIDID